jgi:hypothetical protein
MLYSEQEASRQFKEELEILKSREESYVRQLSDLHNAVRQQEISFKSQLTAEQEMVAKLQEQSGIYKDAAEKTKKFYDGLKVELIMKEDQLNQVKMNLKQEKELSKQKDSQIVKESEKVKELKVTTFFSNEIADFL